MTRPVQRKTKRKKKNVSNDNINLGENQNIQTVKVVIQQPKPKPKPKRKPAKKRDSGKDDAIEELKEELASYDEAQNNADSKGINIPSELGISPNQAIGLKSKDDILKFIDVIREKRGKIQQLQVVEKVEQQQKPNRFIVGGGGRPAPVIPEPQIVLPRSSVELAPPPKTQQRIPQREQQKLTDSEVEKELSKIENEGTLGLKITESIGKFEIKDDRSQRSLATELDNIKTARKANNGNLSPSQINNFISRLENSRTKYNANFNEMSQQSQNIMRQRQTDFNNSINGEIKKLKDELNKGGLPVELPMWDSSAREGRLLNEFVNLDLSKFQLSKDMLTKIKSTVKKLYPAFDLEELKADNSRDLQVALKEIVVSKKVDAEEKLLRDTTEEERKIKAKKRETEREKLEKELKEIDSEKESLAQKAEKNLRSYAMSSSPGIQKYKAWGLSVEKALSDYGVSQSEITRIGSMKKDKKKAVLLILNNTKPGEPETVGRGMRGTNLPPAPDAVVPDTPVATPYLPPSQPLVSDPQQAFNRFTGNETITVENPGDVREIDLSRFGHP